MRMQVGAEHLGSSVDRHIIVAFAFLLSLVSPSMYKDARGQEMDKSRNTSALFAQDNDPQTEQTPKGNPQKSETKESTKTHKLPEVNVVEVGKKLNLSRDQIVPSLGATSYHISPEHIENQSQGDNAPLNQTLLRLP